MVFEQCEIQGFSIYPIQGFKNSLFDNNVIIGVGHSMYAQPQVDEIPVEAGSSFFLYVQISLAYPQ